jgi:hypothetical protein
MEFTGGGTAEQANQTVRSPGVDARPLPAWGLYARNVKTLELQDVRLGLEKEDARPPIIAERVATLDVDGLKLPRDAAPPRLTDVRDLRLRDTPLVKPAPATEPTPK